VDLAEGNVIVNIDESDSYFSENYTCPDHGFSFPEINPRLFSFNAPFGACPECNGLGKKLK
jgi:Excinuclease ABC subunit A